MQFPLDSADLNLASLRDFLRMGAKIVYDTPSALVLHYAGVYYGAGECDESGEYRDSLMALCVNAGACKHLAEAGFFDDITPVYQYVYCGALPEEPQGDFEIRVLTLEDVPFLVEHYSHPSATVKHMSERVESGTMLGVFRNGACMGFAGLHEEGAIGMLMVLEEYRHQGLASALELSLVRRLMLQGRIPYTHVYPENSVSMHLQEKLGFERADEPAVWLCKHDAYTSSRL